MTKISYAQNYEDIMLWRALKHIDNGFYVDVGANDPVTDSVTKLFYDCGWSGINIDPVTSFIEKYHVVRPRDISISQAISSEIGTMKLWQCDIPGWSTLDSKVAEKHESEGYKGYWSEVAINTLSSVLNEQQIDQIHFLKVDVEGAEYNVLKSNDWNKYRPWIVLIEATVPNTQISDYDDCENLLIDNGYHHVYADGLNRYYVANEHKELDAAFAYPPNVFDDFISSREADLKIKLDEHYERMVCAINDANDLNEKNQSGTNVINQLNNDKEIMLAENERLYNENRRLTDLIVEFENDKKKRQEVQNGDEKKEQHFLRQKNKLLQKLNLTLEDVERLENTVNNLNEKIDELNRHSHFWWETAQRKESELNRVLTSRTWRYGTLPVRALRRLKSKVINAKGKSRNLLTRIKQLSRRVVKAIAVRAMQQPSVRRGAILVLNRFPQLKNYLRKKYIQTVVQNIPHSINKSKDNINKNQIKNVIKAKLKDR